jgi:hypothetical protein
LVLAALATIAKIMAIVGWLDKETVVCTREYYSVIKEGNPALCDNTAEIWEHYTKWNKFSRGRLILYDLA